MLSPIEKISADGFEQVLIVQEKKTGLVSITAIHDTTLGPALGGLRMRPYKSLDAALGDVLNLAQAMTYKSSLCGCNLGGGKSVIVADPTFSEGRYELLRSYGRFVQSLGGAYITAEDMGTSVEDMSVIMETCQHVTGRDPAQGGGGDPSSHTARGVFEGMKACLEQVYGDAEFSQRTVALQGAGSVGYELAKLLHQAGAKLVVCDTVGGAVKRAVEDFGAEAVGVHDITSQPCDIFSPCAVGGTINEQTVPRLRCRIVAGAANNQLSSPGVEAMLSEREILYAPDFAINAGGVIMCADELEDGGFTLSRVQGRVLNIYNTIAKILKLSTEESTLAGEIAVRLAKERIEKAREGSRR